MKPVIYHCITRVVDRQYHFGPDEKEWLRALMRMQENFSGCRVLAYCLMSNHIHILLEVPPMPESGISDDVLLTRLRAIYDEVTVDEVAKRLKDLREQGLEEQARRLHETYTYRMHNLSEFMKSFLQRSTQKFNRAKERTGTLWESRFKSVIVEDGFAAKTMAAYIDLNPVRAGIVQDPAEYRWSSYGEAIGGGAKGTGKKARAGLVRAILAHKGYGADAKYWDEVATSYRMLLLEGAKEKREEVVAPDGTRAERVLRKGMTPEEIEKARELALGRLIRLRVRYFTDGAVIGSRGFVDEVFSRCRARFSAKRMTGARKFRTVGSSQSDFLWSARDLRKK